MLQDLQEAIERSGCSEFHCWNDDVFFTYTLVKHLNSSWGKCTYLAISRLRKELMSSEEYGGEILSTIEKQSIKGKLLEPEYIAMEVHPKESQLINLFNQYHLWCFKKDEFHPPFKLAHSGIELTAKGRFAHAQFPMSLTWAEKYSIKNRTYSPEAIGVDILDPSNDFTHFVVLPVSMEMPPELSL